MLSAVWLIPALPLLGVVLLLLFGRKLGEPWAGVLATLMMAGSFAAGVVTYVGLVHRTEDERRFIFHLFDWLPVGNFNVDVGFLVDPLSITMVLFVTGVGALIHLYSIGYMHGDKGFPRFFLYLNLFAFSMLMLVLGDNLLLTFLGWEGLGACSYSLIHAATMVTSGVYLMVRVSPLLAISYDWLPHVIAWVGAITALYAATVAISQRDIKKVLAYSTVSQLGYMFLAVGSGAYIAAIFHMITHAFFKALLFLGAGSVIHGVHDEQDMRFMGALRKFMPITAATFIVGWLAIAGVPPFAGFWSKDEILLAAWQSNKALCAIGLITALLTAYYMSRQVFMVFFGSPRWEKTESAGSEATQSADEVAEDAHAHAADDHGHDAHGGGDPHESPWTMWVPLAVLALLAIVGGFINLPVKDNLKYLAHWLDPVVRGAEIESTAATGTKVALAATATIAGLVGIGLAVLVYIQKRVRAVEPDLLLHAYHYDDAIAAVVGGPIEDGAQLTADVVDKR